MEERQRLEIGERIRLLRERSPFTQEDVAEVLGIKLRGYQKLEKEGTTKYERCAEVAAIHAEWSAHADGWQHVSADWIWDGVERQGAGDLIGSLKDAEPGLKEIGDQIASLRAELLSELALVRSDLEDLRSRKERAGRSRGAPRK
jgi:transcriptional regulator with XRE-family HTH domain